MQYDFDTPIDRTHTWSIKHDFKKENGKADDILPLWVADMDFRSPDSVVEALKKAVDHGIFGYSRADESYFDAVAACVFKNIFSFIGNRACCRLIQLYQAPSRRGLAASALTYQSQRFPFINRKMHVINCFQHFSPADVEILAEIRDLEQGCAPINSFCHGVPSVSLPAEPQHFPLLPVSAPQSALS